jgi:hypothetical protein
MTTADLSRYADSRAVLIGVSAYDDQAFPPIPAARNSLMAMRAMLADPLLCGWPPELVTVIVNPVSAETLANQLADLAERTTGVLLVYYVGHGLLNARGGLCLTVPSTRKGRPEITGLPWESVTGILGRASCPARVRVAILDCCFAGQAIEETLAGEMETVLADAAHIEGVYTLTATTRNRLAHVALASQQWEACTSFTRELRDLVSEGLPGRAAWLTLGEIYPLLRHRLKAKGLPLPNQRGTDTAATFPFTANAASSRAAAEAERTLGTGSTTSMAAEKGLTLSHTQPENRAESEGEQSTAAGLSMDAQSRQEDALVRANPTGERGWLYHAVTGYPMLPPPIGRLRFSKTISLVVVVAMYACLAVPAAVAVVGPQLWNPPPVVTLDAISCVYENNGLIQNIAMWGMLAGIPTTAVLIPLLPWISWPRLRQAGYVCAAMPLVVTLISTTILLLAEHPGYSLLVGADRTIPGVRFTAGLWIFLAEAVILFSYYLWRERTTRRRPSSRA